MPNFSTDTEFNKLLDGRCDIDLIGLMLELAADQYPTLDRIGCLLELDRLGVECAAQGAFVEHGTTADRLAAVSSVLYEVEGFHGNLESYYDPRNSYLNEVLIRRTGIPISLGIVYMSVAARAGLRLFGVNAPGHFVLGCRSGGETLYVDPFSGGDILDLEGCQQRIEKVLGQGNVVSCEHLRPAAPRDIAARVLRNLKAAFAMHNDWQGALSVQARLVTLLPNCGDEQRDLGLILLRAGRPHKALPLLEQSLHCCGGEQLSVIQASIRTARKMAAEMN
jgi:regulator of sirC expression with transglutaminase-like and TPR domain